MKQLKEALITKDKRDWASSHPVTSFSPTSFDELNYGDVVIIEDYRGYVETVEYYIYLPENQVSKWFDYESNGDLFVTYDKNKKSNYGVSYYEANNFKSDFPGHRYHEEVLVSYVANHITEWKTIKNQKNMKKIFEKYDLINDAD